MKMKRKSFASRLTLRLLLWLVVIVTGLTAIIFSITIGIEKGFYALSYHNTMLATREYTQRVLSDVYVAVRSTEYHLEQSLDRPERLPEAMEYIVRENTRIRSCGISFIENYYPQKGRWFCPYAWKTLENGTVMVNENIGDIDHDYLDDAWFNEIIRNDSAIWRDPFFDGHDAHSGLFSFLTPIHDAQGRPVAVLGADVSLSWLTEKLNETDSIISGSGFNAINAVLGFLSKNYIIRHDGTFITHSETNYILKENLFNHIRKYETYDLPMLTSSILAGEESSEETLKPYYFNGEKSYLFYAPIKHTEWMLVTVVPGYIITVTGWLVNGVLAVLVFFAMLLMVVVCYFAVRRSTKPLTKLADSANEIAKGNFNAPLPYIQYEDEIRQLRDSFENMQHSLVNYITDLKVTTSSKAALESELKVAHNIQMSMLPKTFPPYPERKDIDIYGMLKPAKAVGGDLFDFYIREEQLFFCIGDVSGKGVPASLVMTLTRSLFRNISVHTTNPSEIVSTLNGALTEDNENNMFVTLFVGVLNLSTGRLNYCNAGHNAPLLVGKEVTKLAVESNLPLGVMAEQTFTSQETVINRDTVIFLYTDGLSEAENVNHEQFGEDRISAVLQEAVQQQDLQTESIVNRLTTAVHGFVGNAEQSDDLTMLAICLKEK